MAMAHHHAAAKPRVSRWADALGTTIRAEISSSPTTRIDITIVTATRADRSMFSAVTGSPWERLYSSSWATANSRGRSSVVAATTTSPRTAKVTRSARVVVVIAPNR